MWDFVPFVCTSTATWLACAKRLSAWFHVASTSCFVSGSKGSGTGGSGGGSDARIFMEDSDKTTTGCLAGKIA